MTKPDEDSPASWFAGKSYDEIERLAIGHRLIYADSMQRVKADKPKETYSEKVYLRVPNAIEFALARMETLAWASELAGKKLDTEDQCVAIFGVQLWSDLDLYAVASHAVLEFTPQPTRFFLPSIMAAEVSTPNMRFIWRKVAFLALAEEPFKKDVNAEEFTEVIKTINKRRNLSPLAGMSDVTREGFIVNMAVLLERYRTHKPTSPSVTTSTADS